MTGFAQARGEFKTGAGMATFVLTLKSVNHRYLDLHLRLATGLEALAPGIERQIKAALRRGHVDVYLQFEQPLPAHYRLDSGLAAAYRQAWRELTDCAADDTGARQPDAAAMLAVPGMLTAFAPPLIEGGEADNAGFASAVARELRRALDELIRMREFEGAALKRDLQGRLRKLGTEVEHIAARQPLIETSLRERLRGRLRELAATPLSEERLTQEAAFGAERADISEEIARLRAHLEQFTAILEAGGEAGKKLEFLLQELQREAGTMLAKTGSGSAAGLETTERGLRIRLELEKLREQVQNLE